MRIKLLLIFLLFLISISACKKEFADLSNKPEEIIDDEFPIIEDKQEYMVWSYFVCKEVSPGERIYQTVRCGIDTCWSKFYDSAGKLIEDTGETGPGTPRKYELKTKTTDCKRTTTEYFFSKVDITEEERTRLMNENAAWRCGNEEKVWVGGLYANPGSGTCVEKLSDAGKRCKDSDECLGNCLSTSISPYVNGRKEEGICSDTDTLSCWTIEEGKLLFNTLCASI